MTILDKIIAEKYNEVKVQKAIVSISELEKKDAFKRTCISLKESLTHPGSSGIIAEFKRKSPSKGFINSNVAVEDVTSGYAKAGAAGLSVLTDRQFFGGSLVDLVAARGVNSIPILRKDFMVDEYQIIEAKAMGADVILLIAASLDLPLIKRLASCAKSLGLEILFEIHAQEELEKIVDEVDMVGVNNRNLKDFHVDLEHSLKLAAQLPDKFVKVSESGIDNPDTIKYLRSFGFKGFLIGENFMKQPNPGYACGEFIKQMI
ncbi:MAG: indole-3-glycerol phosphate synthase TrpC [Bacteroidota bacterium]|nr:indole-3-glycerol phosphate synthase TrpC [Bacteroidota bacterium]